MALFKKFRFFSRHKKLCEEWVLANSREYVDDLDDAGNDEDERCENDLDPNAASEVTFLLKYLGSIPVETPSDKKATAEAIKTVIAMSKAGSKKLPRVSLAVSIRGIRVTDLSTEEDQLRVSIYRISYCSADATHDHAFAFIATNPNETMECHAFLCPKKKMARTVTYAVARAFDAAFEVWQRLQVAPKPIQARRMSVNHDQASLIRTAWKPGNDDDHGDERDMDMKKMKKRLDNEIGKNLLIDFSSEV